MTSLARVYGWKIAASVLSTLAIVAGACDGGPIYDPTPTPTGNATGGAGGMGSSSGGGGSAPVGPPLVAISTITFSPDLSSRTDSIQFADKLSVDGAVDATRTIELTAINSTLWASKTPGEMFLADAGTGQLIKYALGADGKVAEAGKIGFDAFGVQAFYWTIVNVVSPTKAFLFDEITLQGFTFNPTEMTILSDFDVSAQFNPTEGGTTYDVWREIQAIEVGGKFYSAFHYFNRTTAMLLPRSGMIVVDPSNDTITAVEQPNCGGLHNSVLGKDGKIYSASGVIPAGAHFAGIPGSNCIVRFDPATNKWDDNYNVDMGKLVGDGEFVGGMYRNASNPDAPVYVRHLIKAGVPAGLKNPLQIAAAPLWETYKLDDLTNPVAATKVEVPTTGGIIYPMEIGGKTYVSDADVAGGKSWMVDLSVDPPARALEVPGWGYYAVQFN